MYYEIVKELGKEAKGVYRQMTIDTSAVLDPDGFSTDDPAEAKAILDLVKEKMEE
ncbi:hypothetical protein GWN75_07985 [candidate division KSB1 bacterium]|nr:hypothetical protein [candidate division KSB1 bacterium]NIS23832.1 hypothetical protein [candidate division KSB1 bacterium]NIU24473.1 hypothetical protein [candidate division KSB1 bacterium]NIW18328.1 hypothetical protein [candidate division KSB1 bacterium]